MHHDNRFRGYDLYLFAPVLADLRAVDSAARAEPIRLRYIVKPLDPFELCRRTAAPATLTAPPLVRWPELMDGGRGRVLLGFVEQP